jgi:anti-sigma factor ChrR (cupin superfamily)
VPEGQSDTTQRQAEMNAPPGPMAAPVRLVLADLLSAATDGRLDWKPLRTGIDIAHLYTTPPPGPAAALLRYAPRARLDRHEHLGFEHIYILTGSQTDDAGEHHAGALLIHGPGTTHAIASTHGCLVLAIWEKPVRFL